MVKTARSSAAPGASWPHVARFIRVPPGRLARCARLVSVYICRMKGYPNAHLLTTPQALADAQSSSQKPLVLDIRAPEDFANGHVPGAVHLDLWGLSLIDTDPAPLRAFMWIIDHLFNLRGVDEKTPVVVYDEQSGMRAARAFWFLEYFGHPHVQALDGGLGAWTGAGLPVTRDAGTP